MVTFSMTSHQVLFKSLLPSRVKLTATKTSYQWRQLHDSLSVSTEIETLRHNVCMLLLHVLVGFCLGDSRSIHRLAQTYLLWQFQAPFSSSWKKNSSQVLFQMLSLLPVLALYNSWYFPSVLFRPLCPVSFQLGGAKL